MKNTAFQQKYQKLNSRQKEAVDAIDGPVMVIAGPGTGKTTILTLRIANILRLTDTEPSSILALTYTDAGAHSMKVKLRELIGPRANNVKIHTFHSFAASIISEFDEHFVHLQDSNQINEIESAVLLKKILQNENFSILRPMGNPSFYIKPIISAISDSKRDALTPEMIKDFAKDTANKIEKNETSYLSHKKIKGEMKVSAQNMIERLKKTIKFAEVYDEYERTKIKEKKIDYDDLIFELLLTLRKDKLLLQGLQERFQYILIDEHQDTNDSQNEIIQILSNFFDTPNVFIVGDEKQAIYRFQGASVSNFLRFQKLWKSIKLIPLIENYRSDEHILDASFRMIESNYCEGENMKLRVKLKGNQGRKRPIEINFVEEMSHTHDYLIKKIDEIKKSEPKSTIAVIVRKNIELDFVIETCLENGVPIYSEKQINIFTSSTGLLFFSLLDFFFDRSKIEALGKTIVAGLWGLTFSEEVSLLKLLRGNNLIEIERRLPGIAQIKKKLLSDSPIGFLNTLSEISGFNKKILANPSQLEVWRGIVYLAEKIVKERGINDPRILIEDLLSYRDMSEKQNIKIPIGGPEASIFAMTAHGSKGLEFDYVILPYVTDESWVLKGRKEYFIIPTTRTDEEEVIRDERRLFYVALTRARKEVVLVVPKKDKDGKMLTPLRFIDELEEKSIIKKEIKTKPIKLKKISQNLKRPHVLSDYTKNHLQSNGLSVTALNHFLECPNKFLIKSVLKVPEAPSLGAEKGNAMHRAIDKVWRQKKKSIKIIENIINSTIKKYIEDSFLYEFEKNLVIKELLKNSVHVAQSLINHFSQKGDVKTEKWYEFMFESDYGGRKIYMPVHGKLDVIINNRENIDVFDYKTRGNMSLNEIKGMTRSRGSAKGDYFRQMIFYKYLIQNDNVGINKSINTSLVFLTPDAKGVCHIKDVPVEEKNIQKLNQEISGLIKFVWDGRIENAKCDDSKCEFCSLISLKD